MADEQVGDPRRDMEARLIEKAEHATTFREELLRDPKAAIERELSAAAGVAVQLPSHVTVLVHEETADTLHLVLPALPAAANDLSDAELAGVAGGTGGTGGGKSFAVACSANFGC